MRSFLSVLSLLTLLAVLPAHAAKLPQFVQPWGIVRSRDGRTLVRDTQHPRLLLAGPDGRARSFADVSDALFTGSYDIASDAKGRIYTAKWGDERDPRCGFVVQDARGRVVMSYLHPVGKAPGQMRQPMGIGVDAKGHIYVADTGNDRVQEFSPEGRLLAAIGVGELRLPMKPAFDRQGRLYIADSGHNRVAVYERDVDGRWVYFRALTGGVKEPVSVAVDGQGRAFVTTNRKAGVYMFGPDGEQAWVYQGTEAKPLAGPRGLTFDGRGNLLVVDESTRRVWTVKLP